MAGGKTLYPRGTLKKIVKANTNQKLSKNVDILIFLNYALFLQDLIKEAGIASKQSGERVITARSIRKVRADCLAKFAG
ncbi:uncharacterized protein BDR25DRAFT_296575 [Lindgomyces ingoldianus]|uniref:Uncharacterized protein n=1 Tax=Lindgomyces ingoldianus TaxID=673940 RepID=A0ACB6QCD0_9PLEO|nr:uncharacterized protein BDR25DRAFT_296575 [Lindgomyces ingoldianus]KAF2464623.1 hypothetical protein BDR25DRAFT_296575 [Lindgomyces ingoldianus]